ncbi:uncharacterized protein LOC142357096 isoform X2 [Convolutriloba macropyga]|uniref:uncharacterized protein LOC142357096 isoform X2 n=1 Tax=Convolutriloba macropyga TaxID=536237 RepID=UPI003F51BC0D
MDVSKIEVVISILHDLQVKIDNLISSIDQAIAEGLGTERIFDARRELPRLFAAQISTKQSLSCDEDWSKSNISVKQKLSRYPDFRQWLKSIDIRHALSISLESNFESLESVCETSAEEISLIAAKCGASEAEIDTFFAGIALLKAALDESKKFSHEKLQSSSSDDGSSSKSSQAIGASHAMMMRTLSLEGATDCTPQQPTPRTPTKQISHRLQHHHKRPSALERGGEVSDDGYCTEKSPGPFALPGFPMGRMSHTIAHKFVVKKFTSFPNIGICGVCNKFLIHGYRCMHCRFKCHKKCQYNAPATCGLHEKMEASLRDIRHCEFSTQNTSNSLPRKQEHLMRPKPGEYSQTWHYHPSSVNVSLTSSTFVPPNNRPGLAMSSGGVVGGGGSGGSNASSHSKIPGVGHYNLNDGSTSSSSSNIGLSGCDLGAVGGSGGTYGSVPGGGGGGSVGQRGRISSTTTGASSADISSVESSPSHFKSHPHTGGPGTSSATCGGSSHAYIFSFQPTSIERGEYMKQSDFSTDCLHVPPKSAPYHNIHSASGLVPVPKSGPRSAEAATSSTSGVVVPRLPVNRAMYAADSIASLKPYDTATGNLSSARHLLGSGILDETGGSRFTIAGEFVSASPTMAISTAAAATNTATTTSTNGSSSSSNNTQKEVDSEGVTVSRGSENTSATLTDSENTANNAASSSFRDRWSYGESFDKRIDDDYDEIMSLQDLKLDKILGYGRFATVYKGYWHGEVAVKVYRLHNEMSMTRHGHLIPSASSSKQTVLIPNNDKQQQMLSSASSSSSSYASSSGATSATTTTNTTTGTTVSSAANWESAMLAARRRASTTVHDTDIITKDIKTLCKARHNNVVLFMAACRNPESPAIITSLCKGKTLYRKIHQAREEMQLITMVTILEQIAQGMGYLHGRAIVHKDLRTNNLFVDERQHVTITDYGLANITKVVRNPYTGDMSIYCPPGWLSSLAPELISTLKPHKDIDQELLFTMETDVYAFGVVCFELMSSRFLHENMGSQSIIWSVGSGCRNTLANFQSSKFIKDFLMSCWSMNPEKRPLFAHIHSTIQQLDKEVKREKTVTRCPSHPISMSRSMERMNAAV